jgi:hypothetical protein
MIVRHVTVTGAHHKEYFSREDPPFVVPSNALFRYWNPGVTDISARVQAFLCNNSLSIGHTALNTIPQTDLTTDVDVSLFFLPSQTSITGVSEASLKASFCAAEPHTFDWNGSS